MIVLPRQARDKHRESTQKQIVYAGATTVVDEYLPDSVEFCVCMDGAIIVRAPVPGQPDYVSRPRGEPRDWSVVFEKSYTGEEVAALLREIVAATAAAGGGGELHFGAHPLIAFDEIEFVSSAAHIEWMEAAAESDAFLNMVMEGSRRAIEKYGEGSRLRVVDDFVAEIASQPVRKTPFCLFRSCPCLVYPEPVLVNGPFSDDQKPQQNSINLNETSFLQMAGWVRLYQEDAADPGALLRVVESLVLKFNEEHGSQINCYASSVPVRFRLCAV